MNKATLRRNWLGLIPLAVASALTIVGIAMNVGDASHANPGGPLLSLGGAIAVVTFGAALIANAVRSRDDAPNR